MTIGSFAASQSLCFFAVLALVVLLYCSNIGIIGTESVYALAGQDVLLVFLVAFLAFTLAAVLSFTVMFSGTTRKAVHLCEKLIEQMNSTQQAERKGRRKCKALVVEDNEVMQMVEKRMVSILGADVEVCGNGADAVSVVSSRLSRQRTLADGASSSSMLPYHFILMDCQMPVMDGFKATRRIRELEKGFNVRIPIIGLTAHSQGPEVNLSYEAGMDSCLQKPLSGDRLMEVLWDLNIA